MVLCLVEQVADTGSAHADEHLDEFTAADGEERHAGFSGNSFRQQRFTGAGRFRQVKYRGEYARRAL